MKRWITFIFLMVCTSIHAQDVEQDLRLEILPTGEKTLQWQGHAGRSYFIQSSADLANWTWAPNIEEGADEPMSYEVGGTGDKGFFRLEYANQTAPDLDTADFDGDGLTNAEEITFRNRPSRSINGIFTNAGTTQIQTDPLNPDSDGDGLKDGWEQENGYDPTNADENGNGIPDGQDDDDEDGVSNGSEASNGSNPNHASTTDSLTDQFAKSSFVIISLEEAAPNATYWINTVTDQGYVDYNRFSNTESQHSLWGNGQDLSSFFENNEDDSGFTFGKINKSGLLEIKEYTDQGYTSLLSSRVISLYDSDQSYVLTEAGGLQASSYIGTIQSLANQDGGDHDYTASPSSSPFYQSINGSLTEDGQFCGENVQAFTYELSSSDPDSGVISGMFQRREIGFYDSNGNFTAFDSASNTSGGASYVHSFNGPVYQDGAENPGYGYSGPFYFLNSPYLCGGMGTDAFCVWHQLQGTDLHLGLKTLGGGFTDLHDKGFVNQDSCYNMDASRNGTVIQATAGGVSIYHSKTSKSDFVPAANLQQKNQYYAHTNDLGDVLASNVSSSSGGSVLMRSLQDQAGNSFWARCILDEKRILQSGWSNVHVGAMSNTMALSLQRQREAENPSSYPPAPNNAPLPLLAGTALKAGKISPVLLVPAEVVSKDRYLAGSLTVLNNSVEIEFVGASESLGKYGSLLGGGNTKIYDKVEDILKETDGQDDPQPGSQEVWFVRNSSSPNKIDFYTCFNSLGHVNVNLYYNGTQVAQIGHDLTADSEFSSLITYVDSWVKGTSFSFGTTGGGGTISALSLIQPAASSKIHHYTRAALVPFFLVVNQVEGLTSIAYGLMDGIKNGLQDDWELILLVKTGAVSAGTWAWSSAETELQKWINQPSTRARELKQSIKKICEDWVFKPMAGVQKDLSSWEGFKNRAFSVLKGANAINQKAWVLTKNSWSSVCTGISEWADDFGDRMTTGGENARWLSEKFDTYKILQDINSTTRTYCYGFGYTVGYVVEQVGVTLLTDGSVKLAAITAKGGVRLTETFAARRVLPVVARLQFLKKWAASAAVSMEMKNAVEKGLISCAKEPLTATVTVSSLEVLENGMKHTGYDRVAYGIRDLLDDLVSSPKLQKLALTEGMEEFIFHRCAQLAQLMGDDFSNSMLKNFMKVADEVIVIQRADGTIDEFFEAFFRAFQGNPSLMTSADDVAYRIDNLSDKGKATLKKFLTDENAGKIWSLDTPAVVDGVAAVPYNYWVRGILGELSVYKKVYKPLGYTHWPAAKGFDFAGPMWVQIKTVSNPNNRIAAMKTAIDKLISGSPNDKLLHLHILKKPGSDSDLLDQALKNHIEDIFGQDVTPRVTFEITSFELNQ